MQPGSGIPYEWPAEAPYDDTDSEHEQPVWRLGSDRSCRHDGDSGTDSSSSSSDGGTDDETDAERRRRFRCGSGSHARRSARRVSRGGRDIEAVQSDWNEAMTSSAVPTGADDDRGTTYETEATRDSAAPDKGEGTEHDPAAVHSEARTEQSSFERRIARRTERFGPDEMKRGNGGVTTAVERRAAASQRLSTRRSSAHQALPGGEPGGPTSVPGRKTPQGDTGTPLRDGCTFVLGCPTGETVDNQRQGRRTSPSTNAVKEKHQDAGAAERASREAARLIASAPNAASQSSEHSLQIGARAHRAASAGGGFRVTATIDDVVDDDAQNDAESQRRLWSTAAPRATRHSSAPVNDDLQRKRKRALTADRGRRVLGSRRRDELRGILKNIDDTCMSVVEGPRRVNRLVRPRSAVGTGSLEGDGVLPAGASSQTGDANRQRDRWIHELETQGVNVRGDGSPEQLAMLGSQRQRAEAYAAAAARATPGGGDRPTPVALGSSIPEGLEARAAAAMSLDELVKLPTYSMARIASETDDFVRRAPFPITNVSPAAEPMTPPTHNASRVLCPNWRPSSLTDVYTPEGVRLIMGWFKEMQAYEDNGKRKGGRGLRRPADLILGDEYVQEDARGRPWYLLDHVRSGGVAPIIPLEEAKPLAPAIDAKRVRDLGRDYHDKRVLDQLCDGHRNMSRCPPVTVLSANHSGALRFHEAVAKQFTDDSAPDVGWLQPVVDAERPLILELDGERVSLTGFVATCPARIEPCNGVQQNNKVRTTTDKSWPKLEVLPDGSDELAVNPLIALDELAKSEFPKTTQFATATAVMMQAEPRTTAADRNTAAAADPDDFVHLWKIDLQSAYRFWHNHPHELWMYGKQWDGRGYLDCRTQFGDASMVQDFSRFTDYFLWLLRKLRDGDERLRSECSSFGAPLWAAIDSVPTSKAYGRWREDRAEAGLSGADVALTFEAGYIDDIFGCALGANRAAAMRDLAVGLARFLGFEVAPKKIAGPDVTMTVLGASLDLATKLLTLDPDKAASYREQVTAARGRKSMRLTDFLSITCKLVHAAQYRPAGRPYLTCMFTAMRQCAKRNATRVRIGRGVQRDLGWWQRALAVPNDGVAFFPLNHFPPSGSVDLLEFAYDASGIEGLGAAMLREDGNGEMVCYFIEHAWTDFEKRFHINVKEGLAGYAALTSFYPIAPHRHALAHGDNTTETTTSTTNKSRSALQSVVLQHRADFAIQTGVVTRIRRVTSKDNVLADPVSRLALETFKEEARKLGAKKFVRLPMAPEANALIADLGSRLAELEEDGDPTSGTASSVAEVMAREQRYIDMKGDDESEPKASAPTGAPATARWGYMSGFCGADSMSFASRELGGAPVAGFDVDETVQRLWSGRTGIPCWGEFASVLDAAADGLLDDLVSSILMYISGSPCPDFSSAGCGRGLLGETGSLWLDDCELGIRLRPPVIIREMVTGIFDVDGGSPFWAAVDRYRDVGYAVGWSVRMARRHGDPTSRRRVFLVAVLPECMREGVTAENFFTVEGTSSDEVMVETCLDDEPEEGLVVPADDVTTLPTRDVDGYDGPRLVGTIGIGGMGWSVYDATGPAVTMKTWGQGPGGATAVYKDTAGRFRRLSPWEAMRTHSFPADFIAYLRDEVELDWESAYRLCGNSIPIAMLSDVVRHIITDVIKPQVVAAAAAANEHRSALSKPTKA